MADQDIDQAARWARSCWAAAEPFTLSRFATEDTAPLMTDAGLPALTAILVLRAAPLGPAEPAVIGSALHGFGPDRIGAMFPTAWTPRSPHELVAATHDAVTAACRRQFADLDAGDRIAEVTALLEPAVAALPSAGRPLAAAGQAVTLPDEPWARLWRLLNTLREFRGDGHVAVLTAAGITPAQSQLLIIGWGGDHVDTKFLRKSRGIDDEVWAATAAGLAERGLAEPSGELTAAGRQLREDVESRTDEAAASCYAQLGADGCRALFTLTSDLSGHLLDAGHFRGTTAVGAPWPPPAL